MNFKRIYYNIMISIFMKYSIVMLYILIGMVAMIITSSALGIFIESIDYTYFLPVGMKNKCAINMVIILCIFCFFHQLYLLRTSKELEKYLNISYHLYIFRRLKLRRKRYAANKKIL